MKRTLTKHVIAAVSAAMLTMSLSAGVMAAENNDRGPQPPAGIEQSAPAPANDGAEAPAQDMQQAPPQGEKPEGEMPQGEKPEGEMPQGEKPEGEAPQGEKPEGEAPQGEKPEDGTTQDGQQAFPEDGQAPGNGQAPAGGPKDMQMKDNGVDKVLEAVNGIEDADQKASLQSLLDAYKAALDEADKATDEASKKEAMTAADEARESLNKALSEAGLEAQVSAVSEEIAADAPAEVKPAEKPAQENSGAASSDQERSSSETVQKAKTESEEMNLFQKFLQWLRNFGKKS